MKAFKDWVIAHKLLSIIIAAVILVGAASAIVLPIALSHKHDFSAEWVSDGENHWHACTGKDCDEIKDKAVHTYDNACDTTCNVCGATRTVGEHVYDNACDTTCNVCGATRTASEHVYENAYDETCKVCGAARALRYQAKDKGEWMTAVDFADMTHFYITVTFEGSYGEFVRDGNVLWIVTYEDGEGGMSKEDESFYVKDGETYYLVEWEGDSLYRRKSGDKDDYEGYFEELSCLVTGSLKYSDFNYDETTHQYSNDTATCKHTLIFVDDVIVKIEALLKGINPHDPDMVVTTTVTFEENTVTVPENHLFANTLSYDEENHWYACTDDNCDATIEKEPHTWEVKEINTDNHVLRCQDCRYETGAQEHTYEDDDQTQCDTCVHEREQTTLAFKAGTYTLIYNGEAQTFDKANLVETNVSLDDVTVEYSSSKTDPVWTKDAPVNAGTYYIRLSVAANKDHTSCTVNNLEDSEKVFTISKKSLALTDLTLVYDKDELRSGGTHYINLTSSDISGICGTDVLNVKMFIPSDSVLASGTEWILRDSNDYDHMDNSFSLSTESANYKFDNKTIGKLIIANATTESGDGSADSPYTYTSSAVAIEKGEIVYYSVKLNRTNRGTEEEAFACEYAISLAANTEIVEIIIHDDDISAKMTADGLLLVCGENVEPTIIFGVKYTGIDASVSNTFKLTEKFAVRAIADATAWKNALTFSEGGYKVVLEKNGTIVEDCRYSNALKAANYYKNLNGNETYYTVQTSATGFEYYIYEKNDSGKWERRSLTDYYGSAAEANADALDTIKLSEKWLNNIISAEAFATFTFSEEDLMYHTEISYKLGDDIVTTHIAIKFENGKLVYAEFTDGENNYTIKVTNTSSNIILPRIYTDVTG